jgi:hypothetical protein
MVSTAPVVGIVVMPIPRRHVPPASMAMIPVGVMVVMMMAMPGMPAT